jgi:hypothetical protein
MKNSLLFLFCAAALSTTAQTFIADRLESPLDGTHKYVSNGDISFHQFNDTPDSVVVFGVNSAYFCEDSYFWAEFAVWVNNAWVTYEVPLEPYNAAGWAYGDFDISSPFIQDLIRGSKYVYKYTDAHCSIERGEGPLAGVTAGFKRAGIPIR